MSRITEPILVIVAGGTTLVQAVLHLLVVFGYPLTIDQQAAITTVTSLLFAAYARSKVVPVAVIPPGAKDAIADAKASATAIAAANKERGQ